MRSTVFRLLSGALGLFAGLVAIVGPVVFICNEMEEAKSASQYHGHASFWGVLGGSAAVLFFALMFAFMAYFLLRFSFRGPK